LPEFLKTWLPYIGTAVAVIAAIHGQYIARKYYKLARGQKPLILENICREHAGDEVTGITFTVINRNHERDITLHDAWVCYENSRYEISIYSSSYRASDQEKLIEISAGSKKIVSGYFGKQDRKLLFGKEVVLIVRDCTFMQSELKKIIL
jgi:hypothetical protein